jgi:CheY-like chemotaxis protein
MMGMTGKRTVLIIDDNIVVSEFVQKCFQAHGWEALCAENGLEGVVTYEKAADRVSFILLDLDMPVMGGEEALVEILKINREANVILTTGCGDPEKIEAIKRIKDVRILLKPYSPDKLLEIAIEKDRKEAFKLNSR